MRPTRCLAPAFLLAALLLSPLAQALDPHFSLTQYTHRIWFTQQGFTQGTVQRIFQGPDGFLWLGTLDGLNRFDPGTQQFLVYRHNPEDSRSLSHSKVNAIWEDRRGTLWIGTDNGLNQLDPGRASFTSLPTSSARVHQTSEASRPLGSHVAVSRWSRVTTIAERQKLLR